jgi:hypothetical protein
VGVAAHAVRVTADLQSSLVELRRSRERLVTAQESASASSLTCTTDWG